jgi:hypothetical protein
MTKHIKPWISVAKQLQESKKFTHHLYNPEHRDRNAGMQIKGSKAARKSPFVGTWSSLDFTTSI